MFPRNEVFQNTHFDASSDANEPLIAAGDAEEEDQRLEEKTFFRFKFSYRLLGLLVGFFGYFSALGVHVLSITIWGEDALTKSKTDFLVFSLLHTFCFSAIAFAILRFLRNLVAINYSTIGGRSQDLLEEMVLYMECGFVVGAMVGISLAWAMVAVLLGITAQPMCSLVILLVVALFSRKIMTMYSATKIKPSSSRRSTAEQTMMAV
jgi:hypothetical protein